MSSSHSHLHDFRSSPLPSSRDLWAAPTNREWRVQYTNYRASKQTSKILTVGDLVESNEAGCFSNMRNNTRSTEVFPDVVNWCESLDSLGTLLFMVLPFYEHRQRTVL